MARHLRLLYEGAIYHVAFRGVSGQDLFLDDRDRERFMQRLAESVELFGARLYLYCLMTNHAHLVVETPKGNLSQFMSSVLTGYCVYFNLRRRRHGHVTEGRYKAQVVDGDAYLLRLSRYIHLNPVRTKSAVGLTVAEQRQILCDYRWSSYRGYGGLCRKEGFIDYEPLRALVKEYGGRSPEAYLEFVEKGLAENDEEIKQLVQGSPVGIGSRKFLKDVRAELRELRGVRVKTEDVALRRQLADVPAEEILGIVVRELKLAREDLKRRARGDWQRPLTAYLLLKYGGLTQREVALELGLGTGSAVSVQVKRFKAELAEEKHCARALARIEKQLTS